MNHSRMNQLDAIRAFAVAAVAFSHWAPDIYHLNLPWGRFGVSVFFVLSGFLITKILLKNRDSSSINDNLIILKSFIIRRTLRIFPVYYVTLLLLAIMGWGAVRENWFWFLFYISNIYMFLNQEWAGYMSHLWTLSVEEQFYIVWPFLVLFFPILISRRIVTTVILFSVLVRLLWIFYFPDVALVNILPFIAFDALSAGALLAYFQRQKREIDFYRNFCSLFFPIFIILIVFVSIGEANMLVRYILYLSSVFSFVLLIDRASVGFGGFVGYILNNRVLVSLGTVSYALYLFHLFAPQLNNALIRNGLLPDFFSDGLAAGAMWTALTISGAYISWWLVESPANNLKKYFPYRRSKSKH